MPVTLANNRLLVLPVVEVAIAPKLPWILLWWWWWRWWWFDDGITDRVLLTIAGRKARTTCAAFSNDDDDDGIIVNAIVIATIRKDNNTNVVVVVVVLFVVLLLRSVVALAELVNISYRKGQETIWWHDTIRYEYSRCALCTEDVYCVNNLYFYWDVVILVSTAGSSVDRRRPPLKLKKQKHCIFRANFETFHNFDCFYVRPSLPLRNAGVVQTTKEAAIAVGGIIPKKTTMGIKENEIE